MCFVGVRGLGKSILNCRKGDEEVRLRVVFDDFCGNLRIFDEWRKV